MDDSTWFIWYLDYLDLGGTLGDEGIASRSLTSRMRPQPRIHPNIRQEGNSRIHHTVTWLREFVG